MFQLKSWPKRQARVYKGGRPKQTAHRHVARKCETVLEIYRAQGVLNDQHVQTALWYQKMAHLYACAIGAPRVQRLKLETWRKDAQWHEDYLQRIERTWEGAQGILQACGNKSRYTLEEVVCFNRTVSDIALLKLTLDMLYREVGSYESNKL